MANTFEQYQARNENNVLGQDDNVLCAELSSGNSLLRPITSGSNWNQMIIVWRQAFSGSVGSPGGTDMAGGYYFMGLCSGDKRYSQTGSAVGTHCIGVFSNNSDATQPFLNTTLSPLTSPPNTNIAFTRTGYLGINATGSYRVFTGGFGMSFTRYETQWSQSVMPTPNPIGNNFGIFALEITKGTTSWTVRAGGSLFSTNLLSSSFHIPLNNLIAGTFCTNNVSTAARDRFSELMVATMGGSTSNYWQQSWNTATLTPPPDEASFGYFDTFNVYYRNDSYPDCKLLIKDVIIMRRY